MGAWSYSELGNFRNEQSCKQARAKYMTNAPLAGKLSYSLASSRGSKVGCIAGQRGITT